MNIEEDCLKISVMPQKLRYFSQVKHQNGLERTKMEGVVSGRRGRRQTMRRWTKEIEDILGMTVHEAGGGQPVKSFLGRL